MQRPYYKRGGVTLYLGDCRQIVPALPRVDLLLTDPPYGAGRSGGTGKYGEQKFRRSDLRWDDAAPAPWILQMLVDHAERAVVFGMNYFSLPPTRNFFVWDKGAGFKGRTFAECELAWCSWDANARVFMRDPLARRDYHRGKFHPTQKPVALMRWCIEQAGDVRTILDPYAGSGTTGLAALELGREAVLIEREERYCEIAARRIEAARREERRAA